MVFKSKLYISIILLLIVILMGVTGFMVISDETFVDALYMTIITMSTVGMEHFTN
ncbi:MAG: ion channel [Lutibacter sp.]